MELKYGETEQNGNLNDLNGNIMEQVSGPGDCRNELSMDYSLWEAYFGTAHIFAKALQLGRIRGIVGLFSSPECTAGEISVEVAELLAELLKRDILIVTFGFTAATIENSGLSLSELLECAGEGLAEFCSNLDIEPILTMGKEDNTERFEQFCTLIGENAPIQSSDLPAATMVITSPATSSNGLTLYTLQGVPVTGSNEAVTVNADHIDSYIHEKRLSIPWCDRYHCSIFS